MNDELHALRSFRPEVTGPTDALQLQERIAFMETIVHAPPSRRVQLFGPRRRIVLGVAIALVTAVGSAGATGLIPDDVQQALGLAAAHSPDAALTPQVDQAVERTSAPIADGGTLELWTAPTTGGGACAYLRQLDAEGAPADSGPISCAVRLAGGGRMGEVSGSAGSGPAAGRTMAIGGSLGDGQLSAEFEVDASGAATLFGQVPGSAANVEVVDSAGKVVGQAAAADGWFLLTLPADAASAADSLVVQSAAGASIDTVPIAGPVPPTAASPGDDTPAESGTAPA